MDKQSQLARVLGGEPDEVAVQRMWLGISHRLNGPQSRVRPLFAVPALAVVVAGILLALKFYPGASSPSHVRLAVDSGQSIESLSHLASAPSPLLLTLSDASTLELSPGTELLTATNTNEALTMRLARGAAVFQVAKVPGRTWTVECAGVHVVVTGTRFRVEREEGSVGVQVEEGSVRVVDTHGRHRTLAAGESLRVSTSVTTETLTESTHVQDQGQPLVEQEVPAGPKLENAKVENGDEAEDANPPEKSEKGHVFSPRPPRVPGWLRAARAGDSARTLAQLGPAGFPRSQLRSLASEELMLLADLARESGQPAIAVLPLQLVSERQAESAVASLAAFTLGKLWLVELADPSRASTAFERAIKLGLPSSLREQAFARRVEAYGRSGDKEKFTTAVTLYRQAFPAGTLLDGSQSWLIP